MNLQMYRIQKVGDVGNIRRRQFDISKYGEMYHSFQKQTPPVPQSLPPTNVTENYSYLVHLLQTQVQDVQMIVATTLSNNG